MSALRRIDGYYGQDSAVSIVNYFLAAAGRWRGEVARRIKTELKGIVAMHERELARRQRPDYTLDEVARELGRIFNPPADGAPVQPATETLTPQSEPPSSIDEEDEPPVRP